MRSSSNSLSPLVLVLTSALMAACSGKSAPTAPGVTVTPTYALTGIVREDTPGSAPVPGARVEVIDGAFAGRSSVTDYEGVYRLFSLGGSFRIAVSRPGYETATLAVGPLSGNLTVDVRLRISSRSLAGRVTESAPTDTVNIAAARVRVTDASGASASVVTDREGQFAVPDVTCPCDVSVDADGYDSRTVRVTPPLDLHLAIRLWPVMKVISETIGTTGGPRRPPTSFFRAIHRPGSIVVTKLYFYYSQDPSNPPTRTVEIWEGPRLVASSTVNRQQWFTVVLEASVAGGANYEIRISGGEWGTVTIQSPN